jgi:nucleoside diphosphate kinase
MNLRTAPWKINTFQTVQEILCIAFVAHIKRNGIINSRIGCKGFVFLQLLFHQADKFLIITVYLSSAKEVFSEELISFVFDDDYPEALQGSDQIFRIWSH